MILYNKNYGGIVTGLFQQAMMLEHWVNDRIILLAFPSWSQNDCSK